MCGHRKNPNDTLTHGIAVYARTCTLAETCMNGKATPSQTGVSIRQVLANGGPRGHPGDDYPDRGGTGRESSLFGRGGAFPHHDQQRQHAAELFVGSVHGHHRYTMKACSARRT